MDRFKLVGLEDCEREESWESSGGGRDNIAAGVKFRGPDMVDCCVAAFCMSVSARLGLSVMPVGLHLRPTVARDIDEDMAREGEGRKTSLQRQGERRCRV